MSLSFSMLNRNDGVGSGNQEWQVPNLLNMDGSRMLVLVEKKGVEGIASGRQGTVALVELTTSKNVLKTAK